MGGTRIGEITERADVAAGSFYNHFSDKDAIVKTLLSEITEDQGATVDRLTREIEDPAIVVAYAHRHFVRLALADPVFGQLVIRLEPSHGLLRQVLGPRAIRDIQDGIRAQRFHVEDAAAAVYAMGGALLGTITGVVDGVLREGADEIHAAAVLTNAWPRRRRRCHGGGAGHELISTSREVPRPCRAAPPTVANWSQRSRRGR